MSKNSGKLIFVFGEMGSGKTAKLIDDIKSHSRDEAVVMKPSVDTKNGNSLLSRNGNSIETDAVVAKDVDIYELVKRDFFDKNYLYFDEAQFISREQANQLLRIASDFDMEVRAYGLRLNFKIGDENFEGATRLLQISHELICIESKCDFCEKEQAIFSCLFDKEEKVVKEPPTILISDGKKKVNAHAVCAKCYFEKSE